MVKTNLRCPRCGGNIVEEHDINPTETRRVCLLCSREVNSELSGPFPMDAHVPYQREPSPAMREAGRRRQALRSTTSARGEETASG